MMMKIIHAYDVSTALYCISHAKMLSSHNPRLRDSTGSGYLDLYIALPFMGFAHQQPEVSTGTY